MRMEYPRPEIPDITKEVKYENYKLNPKYKLGKVYSLIKNDTAK